MYDKTILVTGGAGFIGSHLCRHLVNTYPNYHIVNFDALTYAGNLENLKDIEDKENYTFVKGDIKDIDKIRTTFLKYSITDVIHLAAESHVDRSILWPSIFEETNVKGTLNLLNIAKECWEGHYDKHRFHHVSTDEVYGALDMNPEHKFTEETPYNPHSPYSASKASSDMFVKAYHDTYGMNVTISNCSNNYGPNQFPEKLIPLVIQKMVSSVVGRMTDDKKVPIYGTGQNVRDWLYVEDHVKAIDTIFHNGKDGETYNVGGNHEMTNEDIVKKIIDILINYDWKTNAWRLIGINYDSYITYIPDRAGHDLRYAIDSSKLQTELGWKPEETFDTGILKTVKWYLDNSEWMEHVINGEYKNWIDKNYKDRK